jgi:uracil-DNA glycosylase
MQTQSSISVKGNTVESVFGEWYKYFDSYELYKLLPSLIMMYNDGTQMCPKQSDVFKAFRACPYNTCKVIFIGQDPYPQKDVATGILFANKQEVKEKDYSPSLKVIKEAIKNLENQNNCYIFDPTLMNWASQGILMLNSALTVELGKIGSHTMLWRNFMSKFLFNVSRSKEFIFVLFGEQAKTFKPYIKSNNILCVKHPAYYARTGIPMPAKVFEDINRILDKDTINWFKYN